MGCTRMWYQWDHSTERLVPYPGAPAAPCTRCARCAAGWKRCMACWLLLATLLRYCRAVHCLQARPSSPTTLPASAPGGCLLRAPQPYWRCIATPFGAPLPAANEVSLRAGQCQWATSSNSNWHPPGPPMLLRMRGARRQGLQSRTQTRIRPRVIAPGGDSPSLHVSLRHLPPVYPAMARAGRGQGAQQQAGVQNKYAGFPRGATLPTAGETVDVASLTPETFWERYVCPRKPVRGSRGGGVEHLPQMPRRHIGLETQRRSLAHKARAQLQAAAGGGPLTACAHPLVHRHTLLAGDHHRPAIGCRMEGQPAVDG